MEAHTLMDLAGDMLSKAHGASSGRAAHNLFGGREHTLQQTLIALVGEQILHEHENPGEATLQIVTGEIELRSGDGSVTLAGGDYTVIPQARHSVHANQDSVLLLTVVGTR